ncbi:MAG: hypothetical protein IKO13_04000, partial [Oscillospiraceae bacterium]|nr:hypothetical protein [Oscillospiraceae bacterium]
AAACGPIPVQRLSSLFSCGCHLNSLWSELLLLFSRRKHVSFVKNYFIMDSCLWQGVRPIQQNTSTAKQKETPSNANISRRFLWWT